MIAGVEAFPALEGHPKIARGFTPWKREKEKTGALEGRLIIYAYPEINPHKMEENRKKLKGDVARNRIQPLKTLRALKTQEALIILEHGLAQTRVQPIRKVEPFRGRFPLTEDFVNEAKKWGRK